MSTAEKQDPRQALDAIKVRLMDLECTVENGSTSQDMIKSLSELLVDNNKILDNGKTMQK